LERLGGDTKGVLLFFWQRAHRDRIACKKCRLGARPSAHFTQKTAVDKISTDYQ
jgi:hypothetical protein